MNFKDISIKWQLILICVLLTTIPVVFLGTMSYNSAKTETYGQIEERLEQQAKELKLFADSVFSEIEANKEAVDEQAQAMVHSQSEAVYKFISDWKGSEADLLKTLDSIDVGETGYIWVTDYQGKTLMVRNKDLIGGTLLNTPDADGKMFMQEAVSKGKNLNGADVAYVKYAWQNPGELKPRDKIVAVLNIPEKEWIVGVGTYYDELVDITFEEQKTNDLKDELASIVVGKSGYVAIIDDSGEYILSYNRERDGENILNSKDADGNEFIKEIIAEAKSLGEGQAGIKFYAWKNVGESTARQKIGGFSYLDNKNAVIMPSAYVEDFLDGLNNIRVMTIIVCIVAIVVGTIVAYIFALYMTKIINNLERKMKQVADGDLTVVMDDKSSKNEIGQMQESFKIMLNNLKDLVFSISKNANSTAATAEELSASAEEVNASTEQVSSTVQEIAKGGQSLSKSVYDTKNEVDQLINSIKSVASSAQESAKSASEASDASKKGGEAAQSAGEKMTSIKNSVDSSAAVVQELGTKSQEINKVIEVINGISEQTNLLALNAAIEAARAGEAGRGFAVVADEVRKLAEESQKATKQIEAMIQEIVASTQNAVSSMQTGTKEVDEGSQVVNDALSSLKLIGDKVSSLVSIVESISAATQQQMASSEKVQKSITTVSSVAEESAASSEEVSSSVEETTASMQQVANGAQTLAKGADELRQLISRFRLDASLEAEINRNKADAKNKAHMGVAQPQSKPAPAQTAAQPKTEVKSEVKNGDASKQ